MLDMDGTFYLGDKLLPGAAEFLEICKSRGIAYTFLTNNSSKSPQDYINKLAGLGVQITPNQMLTSGDATISYLKENGFNKDLLLIGTQSLEASFTDAGFNINSPSPQAVVLGFDTTLTYQKLTDLCNAVRAGLPYIATHPDFNCPVQGGFIPDIGATIAYVKASTGRVPTAVIGKPNAYIAQAAANRAGLSLGEVCMVGDRLYTDIALGECGVGTALVLCGETSRQELAQSKIKPDFVFEDLDEMGRILLGG